jgi:perosamine synthetase
MIPIAKPYLGEEEAQAAYDTILTGWVTQGPRVQEFEEKFAEYVGSKYAVAVSSCTTALHLAMIVSGIGKGDEVICPSMSYIATANSIKYVGAVPVFAEVNPETYNIDPADAEKKITDKTRAILIVHQVGMPADIDAFQALCDRYKLKLIEDAACAIGSEYKGKKIGSHSVLVCFSFHPRKLITTGDGGMITTSNEELFKRLKHLRQHGMSVNDRVRHESKIVIFEEYLEVGYNYRMTDIQAAVGIKQLEKLETILWERRKIAQRYNDTFQSIPSIRIPVEPEGCLTNYQSYTLYITATALVSRDELMQKLLDKGISTRRGIMNAHREKAYRNDHPYLQLPISEETADRSILLPIYPSMHDDEVGYVINNVKDILQKQ